MNLSAPDWIKLNKLLDEALDLEPAQRAGWMESLPPEYASLRDTLRDLLARQAGLETAEVLRRSPGLPQGFASLASGDRIGPYRLIREIGSGGMATVWLADRADGSLQRQVALKLPRVAWIDQQLAERLTRERDILASLEHPGIARLYDAGVDAAGRPFLALEYVEGVPLDVYVREHALTLRQRLELFLQILRAMAYAHARLVVHRDLKPTNLLVKQSGEVRLLDFGIARLLQSALPDSAVLPTQFEGRAFTPRYAAPEQFANGAVTVATDVYSLGVLLYELLTGVSPYEGCTGSIAALEQAVIEHEPKLPSAAASAYRRALRGDLDCIVAKALRKSPADRYLSVEALAADIERHLEGLPIAARPASRRYRAMKFARRNALALIAAASVVIALAAGLGVSLWQWRQAVAQRAAALNHLVETETTLDFATTVLREVAQGDQTITLKELLTRSEAIAATGPPRMRASATDFVANWYISLGEFAKADRVITRTLESLPDSEQYLTVSSLACLRASTWTQLGRSEEAVAVLMREIERHRDDPVKLVSCLLERAEVARELSDAPGTLQFANEALRTFEAVGRQSDADKATILMEIAYGHALNGRSDYAQSVYRQAFELLDAAGRGQSAAATTVLSNWGVAAGYTGNPLQALALYDKVMTIERQLSPAADLSDAMLVNRAQQQKVLARYAEALENYDTMLSRSTNLLMQAYALNGKADVVRLQGDLDEAQRLLDAAAEKLREGNVDPEHAAGLRQILVQAKIWAARGRSADAHRAYTGLIEGYIRRECCHGPQASTLLSRADLAVAHQRWSDALADTERALQLAQGEQGDTPHSYVTGNAWLMLGRIQRAQGQTRESAKSLALAVSHLTSTLGTQHPDTLRAKREQGAASGASVVAGAS